MKKRVLNGALAFIMTTSMLITIACSKSKDSNEYLAKVLENLEQIKSASYYQNLLAYDPGNPIPSSRYEYYKEYSNSSDTSVGASFLQYMGDDTAKILYGYDGTIQALIDWDNRTVRTDNFQNNQFPFRVIMPPFLTYAKAVINYALNSKDSVSIVKNDYGDSLLYSISFYDQFLEFVGKIPVPVYEIPGFPDGKAKGKSSKYDIWISKSNDLPYKIKKEILLSTSIHSITNIIVNEDIINDLVVSDYFPPEFPMHIGGNKKSEISELIGKKAPDWILTDFDNNNISLKNLKSKILVIEFTGIGCGPCYQAIPFLKQLVIDYKDKDFDFISIEAWNKNNYSVSNYHDKNNLNYKLLMSTSDVTEKYKVDLVPVFFIIDENRVIKQVFEGFEKGLTDKKILETINNMI